MKAVIMAGGQGTRFWPLSRRDRPKQFLQLFGPRSLLQQTVDRLLGHLTQQDIYVACTAQYVDAVLAQLPWLGQERIIVEPLGRNTAPCAGLAALHLRRRHPDEVMALLPSDHLIADVDEFHRVLSAAESLARDSWLVTFGIPPHFAATGYGYLQRGEALGRPGGFPAYRVERFIEKPGKKRARRFLDEGGYDWNSGMFVWGVQTLLDEIEAALPDLSGDLRSIQDSRFASGAVKKAFEGMASVSIDKGVMEKSSRVAEIPCRLGWSDVGSWRAVGELHDKDGDGVAAQSPLVSLNSRDVLVHSTSEDKLTALVGVSDLIIVDTPDALLVCSADRSEQIKDLVEELRRRGHQKIL